MRAYLVRHGQSDGNLGRPGAMPDPPLTELGHVQAGRAALALSCEPVTALYASPMTRALQTAKAFADVLQLPLRVRPDLAETNRAEWGAFPPPDESLPPRGLLLREVREKYAGVEIPPGAPLDDPWWEAQARTGRDGAYARAAGVWRDLFGRHGGADETIVVITHGAFGSVLVSAAVGAPPTEYNRFSHYNCGISLLHWSGYAVRLRLLNAVDHLPPELRTDLT